MHELVLICLSEDVNNVIHVLLTLCDGNVQKDVTSKV